MKKILTLAIAAALAIPAVATAAPSKAAPAPAAAPAPIKGQIPGLVNPPLPSPETVVATVNGANITQADVNLFLAQIMGPNKPLNYANEQQRQQALTLAENNYLLAQAGQQLGADKNVEAQAQIRLAQQQILGRYAIAQYLQQQPVTEAQVKKFYDDTIVPQLKNRKEYDVRHVLVKTEKEAKDLLMQLQKGKITWAKAAAKSLDTGTAKNGGELGFQALDSFVPEFAAAVKDAPVGKILPKVVKTQFGYHVIEVEKVQPTPVPALKDVAGQIQQILAGQAINQFVEQLRAKSKIEVVAPKK